VRTGPGSDAQGNPSDIDGLCSELGESTFEEVLAEGRAMSFDEAVAFVLDEVSQ
jgi:hypothetical protein